MYDFAVNQRNPLLQLAYLCVINGAFLTWIIYGIPLLPTYFMGKEHMYISYVWVAVAQYTFFLASTKEPGRIHASNIATFSHQPYDGLLYIEGLHCRTCLVPKVRKIITVFVCMYVYVCIYMYMYLNKLTFIFL